SAQSLFPRDAPFTAAQAERGQAAYALNCQSCHSPTLEGTQFGPPLKGAAFEGHWRGRTRAAFSEQLRTTMPPGKLGSIGGDSYPDIEGFILQANAGKAAAANAAATSASSAPASAPPPSRAENQGAGMMGPMQRRDDPLYLAAVKARKDK